MITKEDLILEYGAMRANVERAVQEKRAEHQKELEEVRRRAKTPFAIRLNQAREEGMRRADLMSVLRTQNGAILKEYVELAGGEMRKLKNATERLEEIRAESLERLKDATDRLGLTYEGVEAWIFQRENGDSIVRKLPTFEHGELGRVYLESNYLLFLDGDWETMRKFNREHAEELRELQKIVDEEER